MSVESAIFDCGIEVAIEVDSASDPPAQTTMGGVSRTAADWPVIADAVPCLIDVSKSKKTDVGDQQVMLATARAYFASDPVPGGIGTRHRIRVVNTGRAGHHVAGIWTITGVIDPLPFGHHLEVECIRTVQP